MPAIVSAVSAKGGTAKSTTIAGLALYELEQGTDVGIIDVDRGRSLESWFTGTEFEDRVATADNVPGLKAALQLHKERDIVFIDSPPMYENQTLIHELGQISDVILTPVPPQALVIDRLPDLIDVLGSGTEKLWVVQTMVRMRTSVSKELQPLLAGEGFRVLDTQLPLTEKIAGLFGKTTLNTRARKYFSSLAKDIAKAISTSQ